MLMLSGGHYLMSVTKTVDYSICYQLYLLNCTLNSILFLEQLSSFVYLSFILDCQSYDKPRASCGGTTKVGEMLLTKADREIHNSPFHITYWWYCLFYLQLLNMPDGGNTFSSISKSRNCTLRFL